MIDAVIMLWFGWCVVKSIMDGKPGAVVVSIVFLLVGLVCSWVEAATVYACFVAVVLVIACLEGFFSVRRRT